MVNARDRELGSWYILALYNQIFQTAKDGFSGSEAMNWQGGYPGYSMWRCCIIEGVNILFIINKGIRKTAEDRDFEMVECVHCAMVSWMISCFFFQYRV